MQRKQLTIQVFVDEHGDYTSAEARLRTEDGQSLTGVGRTHRHADTAPTAAIGESVALYRALADLSHRLRHASEALIAAARAEAERGEAAPAEAAPARAADARKH